MKIERFDDLGRGIGYINNKVTFIDKVVPEDIVEIELTKEKKKYNEAKLIKIIKPSPLRIDAKCPYFSKCGGCQFQNITYENTIKYKKEKIVNIFSKHKISIFPEVISNKITLKVNNYKIGFYINKTHNLVEINKCLLANPAINASIPLIKRFNICNGEVTIRCNQNAEILIVINSQDNLNIDTNYLKSKIKLVGIVVNNKTYYGENSLFERMNNLLFKISYDSFFQVNPFIASQLFQIIGDNIDSSDKVLDLYCGVGTLSLMAAKKAQKVLGIEVVPNAIINALFNARVNDLNNTQFVINDASTAISKIKPDFNKVIVDPPRSGLTKNIIDVLLKIKPDEIIYVSCDPQTLVRDFTLLSSIYEIKKSYILDMFSYTYHIETILILTKKT